MTEYEYSGTRLFVNKAAFITHQMVETDEDPRSGGGGQLMVGGLAEQERQQYLQAMQNKISLQRI